jgi:putative ABC transport system permease protein
VPENSHIKFDILHSYFFEEAWGNGWDSSQDWKWNEFFTYIQLDPRNDIENLKAKFPDPIRKHSVDWMQKAGNHISFELQPVLDIHLKSPELDHEREVHGNINTVYLLGTIAVFILIISWINYINISTAKSMERAREIGFRKLSGASRKQIIIQFLLESFIVNLAALLIAIFLIEIFHPSFSIFSGIRESSGGLYHEP